jgi:hypothetical protein
MKDDHDRMPASVQALPPIGSEWKDRDLRVKRTVRVVRYDPDKRRIRIHCLETGTLSWAKAERFNNKSGGYTRVEPARQHRR